MHDNLEESMMSSEEAVQHVDTIVIGGGQAGLAAGYHLAKRAVPFLILDANQRIGDAWRNRWDSLRLFTPARYNALPGFRFPAPGDSFPRKDEMADYLESYAKHFRLPVQTGVRVDRLSRQGDRFVVTAGRKRFESENTIQRGCPEKKAEAFHTGSKASWGDLFLFASFDSSAITFFR